MMFKGMKKIENLFILTKFIKGKIFNAEHFAVLYFKKKGYDVYISTKVRKSGKFQEEFVLKYYSNSRIFKKIMKSFDDKKGIPDLFLVKDDIIYFVEVKSNKDGLRIDQLRWIQNHPEFQKIIFCVKEI